jgi:arginine:agmatine antiporter
MDESRRKKLGPFLAIMVVASTMIGSGIYLLPASLGAIGSIAIVAWVIATLGAGLIGAVFAMLATASPGTAGLFSYIREALGPGAGFVAGAVYWASCLPANVAVALAVSGYLSVFVPRIAKPPGLTLATISVLWLLIAANAMGPRFVARLQSGTSLLGLLPVLFAAIAGWFYFHGGTFAASWNVSGQSDLAVLPRTTVMVFWAFLGIESAIVVAVRVRNPLRDVPIGTLGGLGLAAAIYIAASAAIMGILPAHLLTKSAAPFADAFAPALGAGVAGLVALCALLKASGTLGGGVLLTVESAECESVLGRMRKRPSEKPAHRASLANLAFTGVICSLIVAASVSPTLARQFTIVTNVSVVLSVTVYLAASLSLLRLSRLLPRARRLPARVIAISGAGFSVLLIAASEPDLLVWSAGTIILAFVAYGLVSLRSPARATLVAEA